MLGILAFTIIDIRPEITGCKTFYLQPETPMQYEAGQFLTFIFQRNGHEIRRSYSLSSSPDVDDILSITIKRTINGEISRWWIDEAVVGATLSALAPAGMFTVEWQQDPRDVFLVAAGSGIVPVYSILKSALTREPNSRIILIYSNSSILSAIFYEQLLALKASYPDQLFIEWMFSNAPDLMQARLGTFNLQRMLHKHLQFQKTDALVYTCGPFYFMLMVQITCLSMGFLKQNIRREIFDIIDNAPAEKRYYDRNDRTLTLLHNGISYQLYVPYNQSILTAALNNGIELPYSCRAGRCSTCRCKVLHGKLWMHNNEVLTDEDEANGYALTCTGHPTSEGVVIEI